MTAVERMHDEVFLYRAYVCPKSGNVLHRGKYKRFQLPEQVNSNPLYVKDVQLVTTKKEEETEKQLSHKPSTKLVTKEVHEIREDSLVNINTATEEQLRTLSGIGPMRATQIISKRPFNDLDDLKEKVVARNLDWDKLPVTVQPVPAAEKIAGPQLIRQAVATPSTEAASFKRQKQRMAELVKKAQENKEAAHGDTDMHQD